MSKQYIYKLSISWVQKTIQVYMLNGFVIINIVYLDDCSHTSHKIIIIIIKSDNIKFLTKFKSMVLIIILYLYLVICRLTIVGLLTIVPYIL